jgi:teichuronic acid biosynthesis glycosyltransferase TuaC
VKIGVLTTSYPASQDDAAGHFVRAEVQHLVRQGHELVVFAPSAAPMRRVGSPTFHGLGGGAAFGWPGALTRLQGAPWRARGIAQFLWNAKRALRETHCERLIAHWMLPNAWPLARHFDGALEVVVHGSDARLFARLPRPLREHILGGLLARGATLRCVADSLRNELGIHAGHPLFERTRVEPCRIDVPMALSRAEARSQLGVSAAEFIALVVGRLVASKRVARAIAVKHAPEKTRWVVLGDGPELQALRAQFPHVQFLGQVGRNTALTWMQAADVLVSASLQEGAPSVIREARALGTPVWTAPAGDVERWARDDPGIHLVPELGLQAL